ncbi:hypothetical protein B0H14DRAFT_3001261 [Mycena olivaceomarginata]|nr:hypothetical protein B0H14DRAFT_3001261 [Mycena olivaceomarginata]
MIPLIYILTFFSQSTGASMARATAPRFATSPRCCAQVLSSARRRARRSGCTGGGEREWDGAGRVKDANPFTVRSVFSPRLPASLPFPPRSHWLATKSRVESDGPYANDVDGGLHAPIGRIGAVSAQQRAAGANDNALSSAPTVIASPAHSARSYLPASTPLLPHHPPLLRVLFCHRPERTRPPIRSRSCAERLRPSMTTPPSLERGECADVRATLLLLRWRMRFCEPESWPRDRFGSGGSAGSANGRGSGGACVRGALSVQQGRSARGGADADADEAEAAPSRAARCDGKSTSLKRLGGALREAFSGAEGRAWFLSLRRRLRLRHLS